MAERRMFAKTIIDSDAFLDMPISARLLYYDLCMRADDDGFVNSPKKIMKFVGVAEDDLRILIMRKFIIPFENGVVVIKHWRIHNYIRKDTYNETPYLEQKAMLEVDENKAYTLCCEAVDGSLTQVSIDKDSIDKVSIGKDSIDEIVDYLNQSTHSSYKSSTAKTKSLIQARMKEGFTIEDFKMVIDKKVAEWMGTDMQKYLRPETLFGTKFEGYLNQQVGAKQSNSYMDSIQNRVSVVDSWV